MFILAKFRFDFLLVIFYWMLVDIIPGHAMFFHPQ